MDLEQLTLEFEKLMGGNWGPYISAEAENDFVLDGHFTLEQLEAIVAAIKQHRSQ